MRGFVVVLIVVSIIFFILRVVILSAKKTKFNWSNAARQLKLKYLKGSAFNPGVITGLYHKYLVKVDTFSRKSGNNSTTYTRFRLDYRKPFKVKFKITKEHLLSSLGKVFGLEDVEVGDKSFDDKVIIKAHNKDSLSKFLTPERKGLIKSIMGSFQEVTVTNNYIEVVERGTTRHPRVIVSNIKRLAKLADGLTGRRKREIPNKKSERLPKKKELLNEVELVQPAVLEDVGDKSKKRELESELITRHDKIEKQASKIEKKEPEQIAKVESTVPDPIKEEPGNILHEEPVVVDKLQALTTESLCQEIFDPAIGSFDATRMFEQKFKDADISWEGTLISASEFSFDFVFKNSTGVKATFELMEFASGYSKSKIRAVVHFPKDQLQTLKDSLNIKLKFSGKLVSVDALVKNIFVAEGKLI